MITAIRYSTVIFVAIVTVFTSTDGFSKDIDRIQLIHKQPESNRLKDIISFNNKAYFLVQDYSYTLGFALQLWVFDNTIGNTKKIKTISLTHYYSGWGGFITKRKTVGSSLIRNNPIILNGNFFFTAQDALWKSNGTAEGTLRLKNGIIEYYQAALLNNILYLSGNGLWRTDGTVAGTWKVFDKETRWLVAFKGKLFFQGVDSLHGEELWVSDGTNIGTKLFVDIKPFYTDTYCGHPARTDDDIYTCPETNSSPMNFIVHNKKLYFTADDGVHGIALWKSDGTKAGTVMVKDIYPDSKRDYYYPHMSIKNLVAIGNYILFSGDDGVHGTELWRTDGTRNGTTLLKDIAPGSGSSGALEFLTAIMNDEIYFITRNGLWKTNGSRSGTKLLKRDLTNTFTASSSAILDDRLYFRGSRSRYRDYELWVTDGTSLGTSLVEDILPGKDSYGNFISSYPGKFVTAGDFILFGAGYETYRESTWPERGYGIYRLERVPVTTAPFLQLILGDQKSK